MSEKEDKAQKLREIQDRLAEIQKKSNSSEEKSKKTENKSKIEAKKSPSPTSAIEKKEPSGKLDDPKSGGSEKTLSSLIQGKKITQEEKNWQANRLKNKPTATKKIIKGNKSGEERKKKSSMSKIYTIVSLIITLAVCSYFVYSFFISTGNESDEVIESAIPEAQEEEGIVKETTDEPSDASEKPSIVAKDYAQEEFAKEEPEVVRAIEKEPPDPVKPSGPAKETKPKPSPTPTQAVIHNDLIISYSSNSTKEIALNNVSYLKNKGFKAGYYYMPDKDPKSPSLYKVYIGPYKDESAAMPDFRKVVDINDKAFILRMN